MRTSGPWGPVSRAPSRPAALPGPPFLPLLPTPLRPACVLRAGRAPSAGHVVVLRPEAAAADSPCPAGHTEDLLHRQPVLVREDHVRRAAEEHLPAGGPARGRGLLTRPPTFRPSFPASPICLSGHLFTLLTAFHTSCTARPSIQEAQPRGLGGAPLAPRFSACWVMSQGAELPVLTAPAVQHSLCKHWPHRQP